jgi:glycosyltransferase involved in cell wall biosynthesis
MEFPCGEANAFDAVWSASALAERVDTTFFMRSLGVSDAAFRGYYYVPDTRLRLHSMRLNYLPDRVQIRFPNYFEWILSKYFRFNSEWAGFPGRKVLYVRDPMQMMYLGLLRQRQPWFRNWVLYYEAHDTLGIDYHEFCGSNPFDLKDGPEGEFRQKILQAALQFDIITCNTQILAGDIRAWTGGRLQPRFVTLASPLPRPESPPRIPGFGEKVTLGYIGSIDLFRGVNMLLEAMRLLPERFVLRIVGRFHQEKGVDPGWLDRLMADPQIARRVELNVEEPIRDLLGEIERCDIMIQPASNDVIDARYLSPQKSFGYMVRGKPIVAGDVPCHRELFHDGRSAALYELSPASLAECIINLVEHPAQAERIARAAWEQAADYSFVRRADDMISAVRSVERPRCAAISTGTADE